MRQGPKPAKSKESKPPVGRKSSKDDNDASVRDLEKRLAEALRGKAEAQEQQAATAEILRVIGASPTDVQPVFDAIASSAARLCSTYDVLIGRLEGNGLRLVAHYGPIPELHSGHRNLITASVMTQDRTRIMAAGFNGFRGKPISVRELLATVRETLDKP